MDKVLEQIKSKIITESDLLKKVNHFRIKSETIVFTNGCFDLLHLGHVTYLAKAAGLGSRLIVGVNSDFSVRGLNKGALRPLQDEYSRAMIMASLQVVSLVVIFNDATPLELIKKIKPNVLVKGGDWEIEKIVGYNEVKDAGGSVLSIPLELGYSTTNIEKKIAAANC
jgi:D-glycero-beta-D-manno-heptose 1-phosphate adenylyltransferase